MERRDREQLLRALEQGRLTVLTVEEAALVLRIGRGAAYAAARRWRDTKGRDGLPVIAFGRSLRVPADVLKQMLTVPGWPMLGDEVA